MAHVFDFEAQTFNHYAGVDSFKHKYLLFRGNPDIKVELGFCWALLSCELTTLILGYWLAPSQAPWSKKPRWFLTGRNWLVRLFL